MAQQEIESMSPTILRIGPYRFFFNSREETRIHVHVASSNGIAKFWLEPIVALADFHDLNTRELHEMQELVEEHKDEFAAAWHRHFAL